jgi:hypothetical protein
MTKAYLFLALCIVVSLLLIAHAATRAARPVASMLFL